MFLPLIALLALEPPAPCTGQPVQEEIRLEAPFNLVNPNRVIYDVPAAKRLRIDQVTTLAEFAWPHLVFVELRVTLNGKATTTRLPLLSLGQANVRHVYMGHHRTANWAEAGSKVYLGLFRYDVSSSGAALFTISGCLLDEPASGELLP